MDSRRAALAAWAAGAFSALAHGLAGAGVLPWPAGYSDVVHLSPVALAPGWPYLDRPVEYPVLTGLLLRFCGWLAGAPAAYFVLTAVLLIGAGAATAALLLGWAPAEKVIRRFCLAPTFLWLLVFNWDALAVLCVVAALRLAEDKRAWAAGFALGLGFCVKLYPALYLAPLLVAWRGERAACARACAAFALTALLLNLPFALKNYAGWSYCFAFNFAPSRLPNLDSIWSVLRFVCGHPGGRWAGRLSSALFVPGLAWLLWRGRDEGLRRLCYLSTLALLLTSKFFSPQYALWLLPFMVLEEASSLLSYGFELANLGALLAVTQYLLGARSRGWYEACAACVVLRHAFLGGLLSASVRSSCARAS